jgi:hypothetical protein
MLSIEVVLSAWRGFNNFMIQWNPILKACSPQELHHDSYGSLLAPVLLMRLPQELCLLASGKVASSDDEFHCVCSWWLNVDWIFSPYMCKTILYMLHSWCCFCPFVIWSCCWFFCRAFVDYNTEQFTPTKVGSDMVCGLKYCYVLVDVGN